MTVLVTGAGLIGAMTAEMLAAQGKAVVLADLGTPRETAPTGVVVRQCDVTDQPRLDAIVREHVVTEIVHTAAMLSTGIRQDPVRGVQVNVVGTANILEVARKNSIDRVVCASSTTVGYTAFGRRDAQPVTEDLPLHLISERPASIYAMTKIANEQLGLLYHDLYGLDVVLLRYGAVLGGDLEAPTSVPGRLLSRLVEAGRTGIRLTLDDPFLVWDGKEEFVDARDCAAANLAALAAAAPKQRVYNVAPGTWVTIGEFIAAVRTVFPALTVDVTPRTGKGFAGFPFLRPAPSDVQAAAVELGFRCRYGLADSVRYWVGKR
jgi:UDP-glucose 4-epimerase